MYWFACIGSARCLGLVGFVASLATLTGVEQDVALLFDRALRGMFGGALIGLGIGALLAWTTADRPTHEHE